jgi:L-ascorbate metabolism protein UlaG (beta-lactamase superfamily)
MTSGSPPWAVTRIANACVLLEIADAVVLTDPWFARSWAFNEHATVAVEDLPRLTAIIGSHWVRDHWGMAELASYPHRAETPVYVAGENMVERATNAGFTNVEVLAWGQKRRLTHLVSIEAVEDHDRRGLITTNYALTSPDARVFYGGETLELAALERYRESGDAFDAAIGPINGMKLLGRQLVVTADQMMDATRILEAPVLIPIHYAHRSIWPFIKARCTIDDLRAAHDDGIRIVELQPGERYAASP